MRFVFFLCYFDQISSDSKVFYYGSPFKSADTGFIKLDPSSSAWEPAANGFATLNQYNVHGLITDPTSSISFIYGDFTIWNNSYVGCVLRFDINTVTPSLFNTGILGGSISDMVFFDNYSQIVMIGNFMAFQKNPSASVNFVGACSVDGNTCYALGKGLENYYSDGHIRSLGNYLFALYIDKNGHSTVSMFNRTSNSEEWTTIYSVNTYYQLFMSLEVFQEDVWLFGSVNSTNQTVGAARWNFDEFSWDYMYNSSAPFQQTYVFVSSISPDGQRAYFMNYYSTNTTIFEWNNEFGYWDLVQQAVYAQNPLIVTENNGYLLGTNVIQLYADGMEAQVLDELSCSFHWVSFTINSDNTQLIAFCWNLNYTFDAYDYSLPSQNILAESPLIGFQQVFLQISNLCVYGQKIAISGFFDGVDGTQVQKLALWDSKYQKWYQVLNDSVAVSNCVCGSDNSQMAAICRTKTTPLIILDFATSDTGNQVMAQNIQVYNLSLNPSSALGKLTVDNSTVYIATSIGSSSMQVILYSWTEKTGLQTVLAFPGYSLFYVILNNTVYLNGYFSPNGSTEVTAARFDLSTNATLDMDQLIIVHGSEAYEGSCYANIYWPYTNMIYACGVIDLIGDLRVSNWGGYNTDGKAADSASGGIQDWLYFMEPVDNRMYLVSKPAGCSSALQDGCGSLFYFDADSRTYSNVITQGVTALSSGDDSVPDQNSSSSETDNWEIPLVIAFSSVGALLLVGLAAAIIYQKTRLKSKDGYKEIPEFQSTDLSSSTTIDFQTDEFVLKTVLGRGAYGTVWSCIFPNREAGTFAVKQMLFSTGETKKIESVKLEIDILEKFRHPHIVHYCGHRIETTNTSVEIFIFMELYEQPCSLKGVIQKKLKQANKTHKQAWFTYSEIKNFLVQIADGLYYLHHNGVAHRDLKCANILVRTKGHEVTSLHIADFGISRVMNPEEGAKVLASTVLGTPSFMAPEILLNQKYDAFKADIWSFGIMLFEMLTWCDNQMPGNKPQFPEEAREFMNEDHMFDRIVEIFDKCTQQEPNSRPTASDLLFLCESLP